MSPEQMSNHPEGSNIFPKKKNPDHMFSNKVFRHQFIVRDLFHLNVQAFTVDSHIELKRWIQLDSKCTGPGNKNNDNDNDNYNDNNNNDNRYYYYHNNDYHDNKRNINKLK